MSRNSNTKLAFILAVLVALGVTLVKDKKLSDVQNEIDKLESENSQLQDMYDETYDFLVDANVNNSRLREKLGYYEHINYTRFRADEVKVIYDLEGKINFVTIGRNLSCEVDPYEDLFVDTPTYPYKGVTFDYEDMHISSVTFSSFPAFFDTKIYSKSEDGVFDGFYHEIRVAGTDDYILREREIYKYGKIIDSLSYSEVNGKEIASLSDVFGVNAQEEFSINELEIMEKMLNEEKGIKLKLG